MPQRNEMSSHIAIPGKKKIYEQNGWRCLEMKFFGNTLLCSITKTPASVFEMIWQPKRNGKDN